MATNLTDKQGKVLEDNNGQVILATGSTVPTGAGYATGCVFVHSDGADGSAAYVNNGNATTANFQPLDAGAIQVARVELTNAEIKALRATPKTLVAAQGADTLIVVESLVLKLNYGGTNGFTESADNLVLQYGNSGQDITAAIETTGFIDQTADVAAVVYPATIATMALATVGVNEEVQLFNTGDGEIGGNAGNDNTMTAVIAYRVIDLS